MPFQSCNEMKPEVEINFDKNKFEIGRYLKVLSCSTQKQMKWGKSRGTSFARSWGAKKLPGECLEVVWAELLTVSKVRELVKQGKAH
jgi:hypothetical protein